MPNGERKNETPIQKHIWTDHCLAMLLLPRNSNHKRYIRTTNLQRLQRQNRSPLPTTRHPNANHERQIRQLLQLHKMPRKRQLDGKNNNEMETIKL